MIPTPSRGISPVLGTALMVVIVVLLTSVVGASVLAFDDELQDPAPMVSSQPSTNWELGGDEPTQKIVVEHEAGNTVDVEHLSVQYRTDDGSVTVPVSATGDLSDGEWTASEEIPVPIDESAICGSGDAVDLRLLYRTEESSAVIGEHRVPIRRSSFDVDEGSVTPKHEYTAEVKVVGSAITRPTWWGGREDVPVDVDVRIGGTERSTPWPEDVNDGGNPRSVEYTGQEAGDGISIVAESDGYIRANSATDHGADDQVRVLTNGDPVPSVGGFEDQADAASYVGPYIDDGEIALQENQAIYLFELGSTDPTSDAFDRQDAVVLATMWSESSSPVFVEGSTSEHEVVCPE